MNMNRLDRNEISPRQLALTARSAAAALELPYTTFSEKVRRGEIAYVVIGGGQYRQYRRYLLEDLRAWALRNRVPAIWEEDPVDSSAGRQ